MKINDISNLVFLTSLALVGAEKWAWPDQAGASTDNKQHKIDGKVRFEDEPVPLGASNNNNNRNSNDIANDEVEELPINSGVRLFSGGAGVPGRRGEKYVDSGDQRFTGNLASDEGYDGTLDTVKVCRCLHRTNCVAPDIVSTGSCGAGQTLCCRGKPSQPISLDSSHRLVLVGPGGPSGIIGPIRHSGSPSRGFLVGPEGPTGIIGPKSPNNEVLIGPGGPTGVIGPIKKPVLVGPGGPTGIIGPNYSGDLKYESLNAQDQRPVLVGPGGPTGIVGPTGVRRPNNRLLVGPDGPTGIIGPSIGVRRPNNGILVGPGGPTGLIGPTQRPILVGPGGPTGVIGPLRNRVGTNHNGVLVGPEGPTGIIGPPRYNNRQYSRGILVGPGGPTGIIGPSRYN